MPDRRAYGGGWTALSAWTLKAFLLIIIGATPVIVALAIIKNVSVKPDAADSRFKGVRHEGAAMGPTGEIQPAVSSSDLDVASPAEGPQDLEPSTDTVVRNGVTVVSPELLVPVIDLEALETATAADANSSVKKSSSARKRSRYAKRSHSQRQKRTPATQWKAYGLAIR